VLPTQGWAAGDTPRFVDPVPPTTPGEFGAAPSTPDGVLPPMDELPSTIPGVEGVVCTGPITPTGVGGLLNDGLVMDGLLNEGPVTEGLLTEGLLIEGLLTEGLPTEGFAVAPKAGLPLIPKEGPVVPNEGLLVVPAAGLLEV